MHVGLVYMLHSWNRQNINTWRTERTCSTVCVDKCNM